MLTIKEINEIPIVFIIGKGRSGTSLMQTILNAHLNVITINESPLIIHLKKKYFKVKKWDSSKIDEFIADLYCDMKFAFLWGIDAESLKEILKSYSTDELNFNILCKIIYLSVKSPFLKEKIILIVDKNPNYSFFIEDLMEIFPDAKFIHAVRDYRDNVVSSRKAFKIKDISRLAQRWKRQNMYIDRFKQNSPQLFFTLKYEKLAVTPEEYLSEICSFINISFNPEMLNFSEVTKKIYSKDSSTNNVMTSIVQDIHLNLLNPINVSQIEKWKKELSNSDLEIIDHIAGDYASKYGYYRTTKKIRPHFFILSFRSYMKYLFDFFIIKTLYTLPMNFRVFLSKQYLKINKNSYVKKV
jgi:hypothetical protein